LELAEVGTGSGPKVDPSGQRYATAPNQGGGRRRKSAPEAFLAWRDDQSAKDFAPGQVKGEDGSAKDCAPGQQIEHGGNGGGDDDEGDGD
jgi:hypothetical protein